MNYSRMCEWCHTGTFETNAPNRKYCDDCQPKAQAALRNASRSRQAQDWRSRRTCEWCKKVEVPGRDHYCPECKKLARAATYRRYEERKHEDTSAPLVYEESFRRLIFALINRCPRDEGCYDCSVQEYCKSKSVNSLGTLTVSGSREQ